MCGFAVQRTKGYRQNIFKACIAARDMYLVANGTDPVGAKAVSQVDFPSLCAGFHLLAVRRRAESFWQRTRKSRRARRYVSWHLIQYARQYPHPQHPPSEKVARCRRQN
jgi:hypothetical protein